MHGYRIHTWGERPIWEAIPEPVIGPEDVLIDVAACGVGLTVLNSINGDLSNEADLLPRVPGHELVGTVTDAGVGVDRALIGCLVTAYFYLACGACEACRSGFDSRCSNLAGWIGIHTDGGYAPKVALPARNVVVLPEGLDPLEATVVPDAVATPVHVASRAGIGPDDRVAVIGAGGGVGIHMIQVAAVTGATVIGLEIDDAKLAEIERLGATAVRSDEIETLEPTLFDGRRPTVVVDFVGTRGSAHWSVDSLETGGRLVNLATFRDRSFELESRDLVFRELSILGSRYATKRQLAEAAELLATGAVEAVIGASRPAAEVLEIHDMLEAGTLVGRGALDWRDST